MACVLAPAEGGQKRQHRHATCRSATCQVCICYNSGAAKRLLQRQQRSAAASELMTQGHDGLAHCVIHSWLGHAPKGLHGLLGYLPELVCGDGAVRFQPLEASPYLQQDQTGHWQGFWPMQRDAQLQQCRFSASSAEMQDETGVWRTGSTHNCTHTHAPGACTWPSSAPMPAPSCPQQWGLSAGSCSEAAHGCRIAAAPLLESAPPHCWWLCCPRC